MPWMLMGNVHDNEEIFSGNADASYPDADPDAT